MAHLIPQGAAYIDPGTGSMLFTLVIGLLSTAYFFLRKYLIKLRFLLSGGGKAQATDQERRQYVIFSDSKRYWNVFKPICDEFERRGVDIEYWTASSDDPALDETGYEHVRCEFIGEGNQGYAKLNMMSADICLSTTPDLDVLQWKRSKDVLWYAHIMHAVGSAAGYRMFGLDYYDAVLLSGEFQVDEVRELEAQRNIKEKELKIVGCAYLDAMQSRLLNEPPVAHDNLVVLLAPSWGPSSILNVYGERMITSLIDTGFEVVIRPHPQSSVSEKDMLDRLMAKFPDGEQVSWNFDNDNFDILKRSDVMITDFSGVIFDYTLVFDKPVIFTEGQFDSAVYDAAWLDRPLWKFSVYPTLGIPLEESQLPHMREVIERVLADQTLAAGREAAREQAWQHRGESAVLTVDYLIAKHKELMESNQD